MTAPGSSEACRIVWHDLMTVDLERSKEFYEGLFGWTYFQQEMGPVGSYTVIRRQGQAIGGMVATDPRHGVLTHWLSYFSVGDVDGLCERMNELGGNVAVEPRGLPGIGNFAILQDPEGGVFSVLRMGDGMPAPARLREHGSIHWDQLLTRDSDRAARFYGEVCRWTIDRYEMEGQGVYGVFKSGAEAVAGMLTLSGDDKRKPGWLVYVAVDDIEESAKKVKQLGGEIVTGPDIVYGIGKYAVAADATKGTFGLFKPAG